MFFVIRHFSFFLCVFLSSFSFQYFSLFIYIHRTRSLRYLLTRCFDSYNKKHKHNILFIGHFCLHSSINMFHRKLISRTTFIENIYIIYTIYKNKSKVSIFQKQNTSEKDFLSAQSIFLCVQTILESLFSSKSVMFYLSKFRGHWENWENKNVKRISDFNVLKLSGFSTNYIF